FVRVRFRPIESRKGKAFRVFGSALDDINSNDRIQSSKRSCEVGERRTPSSGQMMSVRRFSLDDKSLVGRANRRGLDRFMAEAAAVARLKHDHIVKILEFGEIEGQPYFTMEVAERGSLLDHMDHFQMAPSASVRLV